MLTIRLQRTGKKNFANFRVVVAEKTAHVSKKFHEILGSYNPHTKELKLKNPERLSQLISQHIDVSPTVHNLFVEKGLVKADKVQARRIVKKEEPKQEEAPAAPASEPAAEEKTEAAPEEAAEAPAAEAQTEESAEAEAPKAE